LPCPGVRVVCSPDASHPELPPVRCHRRDAANADFLKRALK
jgi:hypothetical protein